MSTLPPYLPPYEAPYKPVPQVTPFTVRDGITMLKKLELFQKYINRTLVPFVNDNMQELGDEFETQVNLLIEAVNAAIDEVIASGVHVQDAVVAGIFNDNTSATRAVTDVLYAAKSVVDGLVTLTSTGRLSSTALNAAYGAKTDVDNLITLTNTGRLSDTALRGEFIAKDSTKDQLATLGIIRTLTPEMYGAVGDGTTDDLTAFTNLALAITDGVRVVLDASKTYAVSNTIHIQNANNWTWEGGHIKFTSSASSVSGALKCLLITNCKNAVISNLYLEQSNQGGPQYTGISVQGSNDIVLSKIRAYNWRWIGFDASASSERVTLDNCQAIRCRFGAYSTIKHFAINGGRYSSEWSLTQEFIDKGGVWDTTSLYYDGIIVGGSDWTITNAVFDDNGQSGIYSQSTFRGVISGCSIYNNWNKGVDLGTQVVGDNIYLVSVSGNTITGNKTGDISFKGANACSIVGNQINTTANTFGIGLNTGADSNSVIGNVILSSSATQPAIFAESTGTDFANGNFIGYNILGAAVPYSVDTSQNVVVKNSNGVITFDGTATFDRSDSSGFSGRALMTLLVSADNTFGQVIANKPISFTDSGGAGIQLIVGGIDSSKPIKTQRGATGARPTAASAGQGANYFDTTLNKPIWSDGANWKDASGATV